MTGQQLLKLRKSLDLTQAQFARALEVSPVTVNRWEKDDARYKISEKEKALLLALQEVASKVKGEELAQMKNALLATSVAAVIGKAATIGLLPAASVAALLLVPGLGWLAAIAVMGGIAGLGLSGAALPFFRRKSKGG
jgi:DNA-binding transcriptional regulator YiaG